MARLRTLVTCALIVGLVSTRADGIEIQTVPRGDASSRPYPAGRQRSRARFAIGSSTPPGFFKRTRLACMVMGSRLLRAWPAAGLPSPQPLI